MSLSFDKFFTNEYSDIGYISSDTLSYCDLEDFYTNRDESIIINDYRDAAQEIQILGFSDLVQFYIDGDKDIPKDINGNGGQDAQKLYFSEFPIFCKNLRKDCEPIFYSVNEDIDEEVEILTFDDFVIEFNFDDFLSYNS